MKKPMRWSLRLDAMRVPPHFFVMMLRESTLADSAVIAAAGTEARRFALAWK